MTILRIEKERVMLEVGLIVGSTRPNRFADTPVQWLFEGVVGRSIKSGSAKSSR